MTTDEPDCSPLLRNNGNPTKSIRYGSVEGCKWNGRELWEISDKPVGYFVKGPWQRIIGNFKAITL